MDRFEIKDTDAIISIEGWKRKNRKEPVCNHDRVWIDDAKGVVECRECGATISAFYFLKKMALKENRLFERMDLLRQEVSELKAWKPWMKVAKKLESLWRGGTYLPRCPHCRRALYYKDMEHVSAVSKKHAEKPIG